jgi:hypothetical protein
MGELHSCCERLRPAIFRLAAETEENDPAIGKTPFSGSVPPSVGDPNPQDPHVFGPPGSGTGSISQR